MLTVGTGCRKGNRECDFPQNSSSTKKIKSSEPKSATSEVGAEDRLDTIADDSAEEDYDDEDDPPSTAPAATKSVSKRPNTSRTQRPRQQSTTSVQTQATEISEQSTVQSSKSQLLTQNLVAKWKRLKSDLKPEMEMYLRYQHEYMTYYHYLFRVDPEDFVHEELIELAMTFEPLLYAVVAFAAYHHTVRLPDSQASFSSFWKYYCKSIVKLRKYLESTEERSDAVLLTVLQLATFEEYLGDWTNLATHHRAAYGILTSKHTPESIMKTDRGRKIYDWYIRLDVVTSLMAVRDVSLDRSWSDHAVEWHKIRCQEDSGDRANRRLEFFSKIIESIGREMAHTFAEANEMIEKQRFSIMDVLEEAQELTDQLDNLRKQIQEMNNSTLSVVDDTVVSARDNVFGNDTPLYREELWPLNLVWLDWYGLEIVLSNQKLLATKKAMQMFADPENDERIASIQQKLLADLTRYSSEQCRIYNALVQSPDAPAGIGLVCYASLGLASVFLPRSPPKENDKYTRWARRQLANIECQGYVWPPHFRKEVAQLWQDPTIEDWWLPNGEDKPRIFSEIRMVVEDRIATATNNGKDDGRNDLREIKGLFEKMDVNTAQRRGSLFLDPAYINSSAGLAHAASLVSTPEDGSSVGSGGFSPRTSITDLEKNKPGPRSRKASASNASDSPLIHMRTRDEARMSGIWEENQQS